MRSRDCETDARQGFDIRLRQDDLFPALDLNHESLALSHYRAKHQTDEQVRK